MSTAIAVAAVLGALAAPAGAAPADRVVSVVPMAAAPAFTTISAVRKYAVDHPDARPAGTNDPGCRPSAVHPRPVVLLHGTDSSAYADFSGLAPTLAGQGFCVYAINYGGAVGATTFGTEDIRLGAPAVRAFVDQVRAWTGADRVDVVGYSQGATVGRYVVNKLGAAAVTDRWIGLAPPSHGSTFYGLGLLTRIPGVSRLVSPKPVNPSMLQQVTGSKFLRELNTPTETVRGVRYLTIRTAVDEVIQPSTSGILRDGAARDVVVQERCPADMTGHFRMPYDAVAQNLVIDDLGGTPLPGACRPVPLGEGIGDVILNARR
ncbi:esterase/lipase family protein [Williamsia serinedens]|uniref:Lipase (Class 2) n=1 Tax=Williamsia serinedens TaxID=391736 RepID=A0ABT1H4I0_9NOCA|nr:alpha/beta fold hydrolase [Williamsia serinedens]MCP2162149.1 Lipase (class 2) [Williamsia serinedens]